MTPLKSERIAISGESFPADLKQRLLFFDRISRYNLTEKRYASRRNHDKIAKSQIGLCVEDKTSISSPRTICGPQRSRDVGTFDRGIGARRHNAVFRAKCAVWTSRSGSEGGTQGP